MHKSASLLTKFFKEFIHELRTPLSVISNELYIVNAGGIDTGQANPKTKEINNALIKYRELIDFEGQFAEIQLAEFLAEVAAELNIQIVKSDDSSDFSWKLYKETTKRAFLEFFSLISPKSDKIQDVEINSKDRSINIKLESGNLFCEMPSGAVRIGAMSLVQGVSPCLLAILDLVFFYNYLTIQISSEKVLKIRQDLPVA